MGVQKTIGVVLFDGFELLDVFGPLEMFGLLPEKFDINLLAENEGVVKSAQGPKSVIDYSLKESREYDILFVPGGMGVRTEINNQFLLGWLSERAQTSEFVTSVCTGSALLAKAGVLDGRRATTNKRAFNWVVSQNDKVDWIREARWVEDGNIFTSSGVSAGMDMSLALISRILGEDVSEQVAIWAEYDWHRNPNWDPFAKLQS
ncbi:MAG: DJ-1/PfpI family protein [Acidiferrobacterales bacterium]|nr:DJ-1/PfpI family protein [Acidiferrobacterales bacterium]